MSKKSRQEKTAAFNKKHYVLLVACALGIAAISFAGGWLLKGVFVPEAIVSRSLRLSGGYQLIDPLLACNISGASPAQEDNALSSQLKNAINAHVRAGDISKASVYVGNISTGKWADVNPDEKYYHSSLGKIPIKMAYYQYAESHPGALDQKILYPAGSEDRNAQQDIAPSSAIVPGNTYPVQELIGYMIKYSDNNAANLLYTHIDQDTLNRVKADLNIPTDESPNLDNLDFITAHQISTLFRVLYNATYLSRSDSEAALKLLSESSFTQGIAAGVASSTLVAHKLGLVGIAPGNVTTEHELHDCGIVYGKETYHLCIMTRGAGSISQLEATVADLSKIVYDKVEKDGK